jgi:hypothetical protein
MFSESVVFRPLRYESSSRRIHFIRDPLRRRENLRHLADSIVELIPGECRAVVGFCASYAQSSEEQCETSENNPDDKCTKARQE